MLKKLTEEDILKLPSAVWLDLACLNIDNLYKKGYYFCIDIDEVKG